MFVRMCACLGAAMLFGAATDSPGEVCDSGGQADTDSPSLVQTQLSSPSNTKTVDCESSSKWGRCMPHHCFDFFEACLGHDMTSAISSWSDFNDAFESCCKLHYNQTGMCEGLDAIIQQGEKTEPSDMDCEELKSLWDAHRAHETNVNIDAVLLQQGKDCPCIQQAAERMERMQQKSPDFFEKIGKVLANRQNSAILLAMGVSVGSVSHKLAHLAVTSRHMEEISNMEGAKRCTIL